CSADSLELDFARRAYATARLIYLSCDLRLRSDGVVRTFKSRRSKCVLVFSPAEMWRHSMAALLRIQGYSTDVTGDLSAFINARRKRSHSAVVVAMGRGARHASDLLDDVQQAALPLPVFFLLDDRAGTTDSIKESIDCLMAELDHTVGVAHWSAASEAAEA